MLVGIGSGLGVWAFKAMFELVHLGMAGGIGGALSSISPFLMALVPALGGVLVGLVATLLIGRERHHGVAGIIEAVALSGGRLRYWRMPAKTVAAALSIGSGASVGPEDPSVQIGSSLGSMFGRWLRLSDERVRMLVAAGAAGGISAAFNAPIAAVFFALEIILGELGGRAFSIVVLASVISAAFTQAVTGPQPAFHVPAYAFHSAWELPFYLGLGLLAGPVAALYTRLIYLTRDLFRNWRVPAWVKPAVAGLAVGILGLFLPQVLGAGYEAIEGVLNGVHPGLLLLVALLAAKLVMTPVNLGAGFVGGVFAPSLFLGAMLGGAYGEVVQWLFPEIGIAPAAFAMVGMAAVLAGTVHAPLTAILLLFEMTNDYRIILPLMFAVTVSLVLSQFLHRESIYTFGLKELGVRLERGRDLEVLEGISVREVMQMDSPTLRESDTLDVASETLMRTRHYGLPVVDETGGLVGVVTIQDLDRARRDNTDGHPITVGAICTRELLTAFPDETLGAAMRRMGSRDVGRLPVVDRRHPERLLGVLRRNDMIRAYNVALARRTTERHREQQVRLGTVGRVTVEEVIVERGARLAGLRIREVAWPEDCVVATIRRGSEVLIPNGGTILETGDRLVLVAEPEAIDQVRQMSVREHDAGHHPGDDDAAGE